MLFITIGMMVGLYSTWPPNPPLLTPLVTEPPPDEPTRWTPTATPTPDVSQTVYTDAPPPPLAGDRPLCWADTQEHSTRILLMLPGDEEPRCVLRYPFGSNSTFPVMSPDQRWIALIDDQMEAPAGKSGDRLYLIGASGKPIRCLSSDLRLGYWTFPSWSADSRTLYFEGRVGEVQDLLKIEIDGTGAANLTSSPGKAESNARPSPDGRWIAFQLDGRLSRMATGPDGPPVRDVTPSCLADAWDPRWSPDSQSLLVNGVVHPGDPDVKEVLSIVRLSDGACRILTPDGGRHPRWSPDGTRIAFYSYRGGAHAQLYVMAADGSGQTRLTTDGAHSPTWSPDGRLLAFLTGRGIETALNLMEPDGSNRRELIHELPNLGISW